MLKQTLAIVALGALALPASGGQPPTPTVLRGRAQGTTYSIKFWVDHDRGAAADSVQKDVEALLERIDRQMSTWRQDSEVSRFNRAPAGEWVVVSPETAELVERALDFHRKTHGAFDVTVGPLARLWGFGAAAPPPGQAPTAEQLRRAMDHVDARRLQVRTHPPALSKTTHALEVDLSGIAQGYTVDALVELLAERGVGNAMVELGGEVRAVGVRPDGQPWRIGVENAASRGLAAVVPLANLALTTAGDSRTTRELGGTRYTHIIDPRTGAALPYRGESVTVLAPTALEADALDTALMVLGSQAAYQWCVEHNVAALFQTRQDDGSVAVRVTPRFRELMPDGWEATHGAAAE